MTYGAKTWPGWVLEEGDSFPFIRQALNRG